MSDCIFCRIAAGALEAEIVYQDEAAVAFLDRHPAARGHVMVIPRVHAANLLELDEAEVGRLFLSVKKVMQKVSDALRPLAMNVGWNHGKDAGQHVFHLHVHVLPRFHAGGRGVQMMGEGTGHVSFAELGAAIRSA